MVAVRFLGWRLLSMIGTLMLVSVVAFVLIQLPPGDFADSYIANKSQDGTAFSQADLLNIRHKFGLDRPWHEQYLSWIGDIVFHLDFGFSWQWQRPVGELILNRMPFTLVLAFSTLLFMYGVALPIGIYSAVRQYSVGDHVFSFIGYIGLAVPNFLLALILMYLGQRWFGQSVGGLFSPEFQAAPWSWPKLLDLLAHLWVPVIVLGTSGTAYLVRSMRAVLLDELDKMYVVAARASGIQPLRLLFKYPVRLALIPIAATIGWRLTYVISGAPIVGVVMGLPDTGPLFLGSLLNQDMQLAGALVFIFSALTVIGTFVSDVLLALLDPRIKLAT